jgi:hypothetical protein
MKARAGLARLSACPFRAGVAFASGDCHDSEIRTGALDYHAAIGTETFPRRAIWCAQYRLCAELPAPNVGSRATVASDFRSDARKEATMHSLIYLVGLIVVVLLILSFLGLR